MGREIRRVPPDWEHPRSERYPNRGHLQPLYDRAYVPEANEWIANLLLWQEGNHPDQIRYKDDPETSLPTYYWEWTGSPPDPEYYRPDWPQETATAYQVYETVSEGTPVSPVCQDEDELLTWLVQTQGMTEQGARRFIKDAYVPSFLFSPATGLLSNFQIAEVE